MSLGRTKAEWERFLGRELASVFLAALRDVRESYDRATRERVQVWNLNDVTSGAPHFKALVLVGVDYGRNTSPEGRLWVWITPSGAAWDVRLFRAPGGVAQDEVARAAGVAPGGTAPLVAQLGSGLAGQVTLGLAVAAETNDRHQLLVCVDYAARVAKVWNQLEGVEDDAASRLVALDMLASLAALDLQKIDVVKRALARFLLRDGQRNPVGRGNEFNRSAARTLASDVEEPDRSGNVARSRTGFFPLLAGNMQDETVGGEQDVARRLVKADAAVFAPENVGKGAVAAHLPLEKAPVGVHTLRCDAGADTDALGAETFSGEFVATDGSGETFTYSGLRVERDFSGPRGLGPLRLRRVYTKTGDGLHLTLAAPTTGHFHGESGANTDLGVVHWRVLANGPGFDVEFHKDSKRSQLVARATGALPGQPFEAVEQNASRLTVTWALGALPTAGATGTLDCNPFFVRNKAGAPDSFTITTSVVGVPGLIQRMVAEELDVALNSDAPGAETIKDEWAMAGTFVPFLVQDN